MKLTIEADGNKFFLCGDVFSGSGLFLADDDSRARHFASTNHAHVIRESKWFQNLLQENFLTRTANRIIVRIENF